MPYQPPPDLAGLSLGDISELVEQQKLPPLADWSPERIGDSEMRIDRAGNWFHRGDPIRRPAMVRAFSRLLWREEDGSHWLVTPFEKLNIEVEDAPFLAVEMQAEGTDNDARIAFRLNTDELVIAGPDHPLTLGAGTDPDLPYLFVRRSLLARLSRPVYYELAERALEADADDPAVWSGGMRFPLGKGA